jgi:tetratricopeptide (TPR) repeat protein
MTIGCSLIFLLLNADLQNAGQGPHEDSLATMSSCAELNRQITLKAERGELSEAEDALLPAIADEGRTDPACAGLLLNNLAAVLSASGRYTEAEAIARRSVAVFESVLTPDSAVLLRPLQILSGTLIEQGKIGEARKAVRKMERVHTTRPEELAMLHGIRGALFEAEGRLTNAESEFLIALADWTEAGRSNSADVVSVLNAIASLYVRQGRLDEAIRVLDRAFAAFATAQDVVPIDRMRVLQARAVLYSRERKWHNAAQDLQAAILVADVEPKFDPAALAQMLADYADLLRKDHKRREARAIDARARALQPVPTRDMVVDTTELSLKSGHNKSSRVSTSEDTKKLEF